jgi:EAL domain-containing protein (putative c-di-GMP-specific phosphodiesterase class I)
MVLTNSFQALSDTSMDISINLSSLDIQKEETVKKFLDLLEAHKTEAHRIVLELLEDEKIENIHVIQDFIQKVKLYGVHLAIDDFGEGYSNFTRLLKYKPDFIKIDGSLIKHIEEDDFSKHMVETIVTFAKKRNIKTIAEYVENRGIFEILCHLGVDYSQGYYLGKPDILK